MSSIQRGGEGSDSASTESLLQFFVERKCQCLTENEFRPLAQQLARTLSLIHAHGVVHRRLQLYSIIICGEPSSTSATACARHRRVMITDFTCATVPAVPTSGDTVSPDLAGSLARCGDQDSPAPEMILGSVLGTQPHWILHYSRTPVDVWNLGIVLYSLLCGNAFERPTMEMTLEASLCSPESLQFLSPVSADCRNLLQRMLHADPFARASLDEVLNHPWMNSDPPEFRCPSTCLVDTDVPKYAALLCPNQVDRNWVYLLAELETRNGDDVWRNLTDALKQVSRICDPCGSPD